MGDFVRSFNTDTRGGVLIYTAILLPVFLGFMALGLDIAAWHIEKRQSQTMADFAAVAAGIEKEKNASDENLTEAQHKALYEAAALAVAQLNGFDGGAGHVLIINSPPTRGDSAGVEGAIEVIVQIPQPIFLSGLVGIEEGSFIGSRAVVGPGNGGDFCILILDGSDSSAFKISGTANLTMECGIAVKSDDVKAFEIPGTATVDATIICVEGQTKVSGIVNFVDAIPEDFCDTPDDPLASLGPPVNDADTCTCAEEDYHLSGNGGFEILEPGIYCNGIQISGNSNDVTFQPGEYIIAGGGLKFSGADNFIHGDGVFFFNTDNCGDENFGDIDFAGNNQIDYSAPLGGPYAGIIAFNDRSPESEAANTKFKKAGTVDSIFDGLIYWPNGEVQFSGTVNDINSCGVKIISKLLDINGTVDIFSPADEGCASNKVAIGGRGGLGLVE